MEGPIVDIERFLLETKDFRLLKSENRSRTDSFSKEVYERSRNKEFDSFDQAHADWISHGRQEGLDFDIGKDTILKIVLKVKDEPEFLPLWIEYHTNIVGSHNIIIVDCGSKERSHLDFLGGLSSEILVLSYSRHYDDLHHIPSNFEFYKLLSASCKYLTLLDADEFLFGHDKGMIGPSLVKAILTEGNQEIYAGTWFPNVSRFTCDSDRRAFSFNIDNNAIKFGTIAGKSILRSKICLDVINLGHNLHVLKSLKLFKETSFGKFGILHLTKSEIQIARHRSLKHLRSKGVVPDELLEATEIERYLKDILTNKKINGIEAHYAQKYIGLATAEENAANTFEASLSATSSATNSPIFSKFVTEFDFVSIVEERRKSLASNTLMTLSANIVR